MHDHISHKNEKLTKNRNTYCIQIRITVLTAFTVTMPWTFNCSWSSTIRQFDRYVQTWIYGGWWCRGRRVSKVYALLT